MDLGEVLLGLLRVGLDGLAALAPVGGADLAVLLGELEGINETEGLVNGTADGEIVNSDLSANVRISRSG